MVYKRLKMLKVVVDKVFKPLMIIFDKVGVKPIHLTAMSLPTGLAGVFLLYHKPTIAFPLVLLYFTFDFMDGMLARHTNTVTEKGAWLDYNIDRLIALAFLLTLLVNTNLRLFPLTALLIITVIWLDEKGFKIRKNK